MERFDALATILINTNTYRKSFSSTRQRRYRCPCFARNKFINKMKLEGSYTYGRKKTYIKNYD